eukprot:Selendium_serpulae@DN4787_c0_g1_i1.p1
MSTAQVIAPRSHDVRSEVAKFISFPDFFAPERVIASPAVFSATPGVEKFEHVKVKHNERLTSTDYDRNIFHIEFDVSNTKNLKNYKIGDAMSIIPVNNPSLVDEAIAFLGVDPEATFNLQDVLFDIPEGFMAVCTVDFLLRNVLDMFGQPGKDFYAQLYPHAPDIQEKVTLAELTLDRCKDEFQKRVNQGVTYFSILKEFPSARPSLMELARMIPPLAPRVYSISSAASMQRDTLHLCVVENTFKTSLGETKHGLCSPFLSRLAVGDSVAACLSESLMHLPADDKAPIVMAGLGTGMAPFRSFLQERSIRKRSGIEVGENVLYFGSRHKSQEFLYGSELEAYQVEGSLTRLNCAFSRDQPEKIYIQHRIKEDAQLLVDLLLTKKGTFYLCGPTWPVEAIRAALVSAFMQFGNLSEDAANEMLAEMKEQGRFILEVY